MTCPINLKPMLEWLKETDEKVCKPCILGPIAQWYSEELKDRGHIEKAAALESLVDRDGSTNEDLCAYLDRIKEEVTDADRERLLDFDCEIQSFTL